MKKEPYLKISLKDLKESEFFKGEKFQSSYIKTRFGVQTSKVHVWGNVLQKFESLEKEFSTITIDDFSETIQANSFEKGFFKEIKIGDRVEVLGKVRQNQNSELCVLPDFVKKINSKQELLLRAEILAAKKYFEKNAKEENTIVIEKNII